MVTKCIYSNKEYSLVNKSKILPDCNVFTVIVGKNGTGKSRFISSIAQKFLEKGMPKRSNISLQLEFQIVGTEAIEFDVFPSRLISVSTSPFDRFPLPRFSTRHFKNYSYLGIRDLLARNFGIAYMSKVFGSLLEAMVKDSNQIKRIAGVLNHLGYSDKISVKLNSRIRGKYIEELISSKKSTKPFEDLYNLRGSGIILNRQFFENEDSTFSKAKVSYLKKALIRARESNEFSKGYSVIEISKYKIWPQYSFKEYYDDLIFFIKSGIVRLNDIVLERSESRSPFSLNGASSGEQSTLISLLGIASQIQDNSVILIDEPEICLHPEWQEKYIQLLVDTFCSYKRCHFIIATHSPQVVSNLTSKNSFILAMESAKLTDADLIINHSADFQLANIFDSPGFKNEYLIRIGLSTFAKVSKNKKFDVEDETNYRMLSSQSEFLIENDPVLDLYRAINDLYKLYGGNK
jgi:predicted ATPase